MGGGGGGGGGGGAPGSWPGIGGGGGGEEAEGRRAAGRVVEVEEVAEAEVVRRNLNLDPEVREALRTLRQGCLYP